MKTLASIFVLILFIPLYSQKQVEPPCSSPESSQFDFWTGEWNLTWGDSLEQQGTNNISKILGGCVIYEQFDGSPSIAFKGYSFSVFNKYTGKWHQTWVDNGGNYLDFTGEYKDGRMILSREVDRGRGKFLQRMIFHSIAEDSFIWDWERSDDEGQTWKLLWQIHYERAD